MRFHWQVDVPENGTLTAEQAWALLEGRLSAMLQALQRCGGSPYDGGRHETSPLTETQTRSVYHLCKRLEHVVSKIGLDPVEAIGKLAAHPEQTTTPEQTLINDPHGDIHRYVTDHSDWPKIDPQFMLAKMLLSDARRTDVEAIDLALDLVAGTPLDEHMPLALKQHADYSRSPCVHECPRCETDGYFGGRIYARDLCKRCKGYGYLVQTTAPGDNDPERGMTLGGRKAINSGESWTLADEIVEMGYESFQDFRDDDGEIDGLPSMFHAEAQQLIDAEETVRDAQ